MLFRNLTLFQLQQEWSGSAADLEAVLAARPLRPCGALDMQTRRDAGTQGRREIGRAHV